MSPESETRFELTQADAAELLCVPIRTLQNWEIARTAPAGGFRLLIERILKSR
jgi:DNA-binding transcriptional regulator YiaG